MIRETRGTDWPAVQALYSVALPEEDLTALLRALLAAQDDAVSFVRVTDTDTVLGHVALTLCSAHSPVALLGPLAVAPEAQGQGHGAALIAHGCQAIAQLGISHICVLGDPDYYSLHGFARETRIEPPYALPEAWAPAWQSRRVAEGSAPHGPLVVPAPWQNPTLWA